MSCQFCSDTGWEITERGAVRCRHTKQAKPAESFTPITPGSVSAAVKSLGALAFFPQDQPSQTIIGDALAAMCPSVESLRYVVRRAVALYRCWDKCGVPGLRQIVCARYRPADGIESRPTDEFPEGLPSESKHDPLALPEGARKALPPGEPVTADPELDAAIQKLAAKCRMPPAHPVIDAFARMLREIETPPHLRESEESAPVNPNFKPVTQADIDRAVQELHERRARETKEKATKGGRP
jgi:hypothetical protein